MSLDKKLAEKILISFAVGDAVGMPTEFMTLEQISEEIGFVNKLLPSSMSKNHSNLASGSITDDTEQVIYLLKAFISKGISVKSATDALLKWIEETDAIEKKYIGPSSLKALNQVREGKDYNTTGIYGTTCGGIMRTLAPVLYSLAKGCNQEELVENIKKTLIVTHNTSPALESAVSYAFALVEALDKNSTLDSVLKAACNGALIGRNLAPYKLCCASTKDRIPFLQKFLKCNYFSDKDFMNFVYGVIGTSLESQDVASSVFALFIFCGKDVWKAITLAASMGGDTDTIAALSGALCTAFAKNHNIPKDILDKVITINDLNFSKLLSGLT